MLPETLGIHVGHVIPSISLSRVISRARSVKLRYNKTVGPILQTMVACLCEPRVPAALLLRRLLLDLLPRL
jgi:hypothetical protein